MVENDEVDVIDMDVVNAVEVLSARTILMLILAQDMLLLSPVIKQQNLTIGWAEKDAATAAALPSPAGGNKIKEDKIHK
jgi:hypothetical protein